MAASPAAAADVATPFDGIDRATANDLDAAGNEIPITAATTVVRERTYDSSSFTMSADESSPPARNGCFNDSTGTTVAFGGKSAWTRFLPGVKGRLTVEILTSYDAITRAFRSANVPFSAHAIGAHSFTADMNCSNQNAAVGGGLETVLVEAPVPANEPVHIQTMGVCAVVAAGTSYTAACPTPDGPATPSGSTLVRFTFFPDNQDGDGVADTLDACPAQAGAGADGCVPAAVPPPAPDLDPDRDGIPVPVDRCPTQAGSAADGCTDTDGDTVSDRVDHCPTDKGDRIDGCPSAIDVDVSHRWLFFGRRTKLALLSVRAPVGVSIVARCTGRRRSDCPFARKTVTATERTTNLTRYFKRKRILDPGTTITVRVTLAGRIGAYQKFTMRTRRLPRVTKRCIDLRDKLTQCL